MDSATIAQNDDTLAMLNGRVKNHAPMEGRHKCRPYKRPMVSPTPHTPAPQTFYLPPVIHLEIHPETPQSRHIKTIAELLKRDSLLLYPTDSGYAVCCSAKRSKAIHKLYAIKKPIKKAFMALILPDISKATEYAKISNFAFQILRNRTPGAYTFILPADPQIARKLDVPRPEIGIRISPHIFIRSLFEQFDEPLLSTAAKLEDNQSLTTPEELLPIFKSKVEVFADMGIVPINPTNIVSLMGDEATVIRGAF